MLYYKATMNCALSRNSHINRKQFIMIKVIERQKIRTLNTSLSQRMGRKYTETSIENTAHLRSLSIRPN